jgi:hypothetical protein
LPAEPEVPPEPDVPSGPELPEPGVEPDAGWCVTTFVTGAVADVPAARTFFAVVVTAATGGVAATTLTAAPTAFRGDGELVVEVVEAVGDGVVAVLVGVAGAGLRAEAAVVAVPETTLFTVEVAVVTTFVRELTGFCGLVIAAFAPAGAPSRPAARTAAQTGTRRASPCGFLARGMPICSPKACVESAKLIKRP